MATLKDLIKTNNLTGSYQAIANALNAQPLVNNPISVTQVSAANATSLLSVLPLGDVNAFLSQNNFIAWIQGVNTKIIALETGSTKTTAIAASTGLLAVIVQNGLTNSTFSQLIVSLQTNVTALGYLLTLLAVDGLFSSAGLTAITSELQRTVADPNYQSQIPGQSIAQAAGLGVVTPEQVQTVSN
jgi:hypothetical protein